jgi:hypothetical protein
VSPARNPWPTTTKINQYFIFRKISVHNFFFHLQNNHVDLLFQISFPLSGLWFEHTIYLTRDEHANHYTTEAINKLKIISEFLIIKIAEILLS